MRLRVVLEHECGGEAVERRVREGRRLGRGRDSAIFLTRCEVAVVEMC